MRRSISSNANNMASTAGATWLRRAAGSVASTWSSWSTASRRTVNFASRRWRTGSGTVIVRADGRRGGRAGGRPPRSASTRQEGHRSTRHWCRCRRCVAQPDPGGVRRSGQPTRPWRPRAPGCWSSLPPGQRSEQKARDALTRQDLPVGAGRAPGCWRTAGATFVVDSQQPCTSVAGSQLPSQRMGRKVDLDDLLDAREVAELLGLASANAVNVYVGRYRDFPEPVLVRPGFRLWLRTDVEAWARETGRSRPGR
jgi:hypothetical protein